MADVEKSLQILSSLKSKIKSGDLDGAKSCVVQLKILMLDFPTGDEFLAIATETLESAVLISIEEGDLSSFSRNISQVKSYYENPQSKSTDQRSKILGLNLMYLLIENRLSEFHADLELLSEDEASNRFITFPITLERQLMVGSYDEVLNAGSLIPDASYNFFVENLLQTVRDSIADCLEVAYKTMSLEEARIMMKFDSNEDLDEYIQECRDDWISEGGDLCFQPPTGGSKASDIPSRDLIKQVLSYATELERIV